MQNQVVNAKECAKRKKAVKRWQVKGGEGGSPRILEVDGDPVSQRHPTHCHRRNSPNPSTLSQRPSQICKRGTTKKKFTENVMETDDKDAVEIKRLVLQSTLQEVAARPGGDDGSCCVICLDEITDACEAVPCGHADFDYMCALSWLLQTPLCPLCKTPVTSLLHGAKGKPGRPVTKVEQPAKLKPTRAEDAGSTRAFLEQMERRRRHRQCTRNRRYEGGPRDQSDALRERRRVYQQMLFSKHVGSNRVSRYKELTPELFVQDQELTSRARMWIRRELRVFAFLSTDQDDAGSGSARPTDTERRRANNAEFLLEYIIAILKSVDIMGSAGQAEGMMAEFLGRDNTRLFLHEMRAWLRSPFIRLEDWDRAVQYSVPAASMTMPRKGDFYRPRQRQRRD